MHASHGLTLPAGNHYALTWGLPVEFVGMTAALLHRSRCFVELTGTPVTILTLAPGDYDSVRAELTRRDFLVDGLTVLNLFEDLATWDDERLARTLRGYEPAGAGLTSLAPDAPGVWLQEDGTFRSNRPENATAEDLAGRTIQRDHLRPDGTTVVIEQLHVGVEDGRHFTVCDSTGRPMSTIATRRNFVQFWLDTLPRDPMAWMVADSTSMAEYLLGYDRDDVVTIHVVHNNHIDIWKPGDRELNQNARVLRSIDDFDACVFLTERQRSHVAGIVGPDSGRRFVIPNACRVPDELPGGHRDQYRGVQIGSLIKRKRIDNGIEAVAMAADTIAWGRRPHLDVYGKGHRHDYLQSVIDEHRDRPRPVLRARLRRWLGRPIGRRVARVVERRGRPPATLHGYASHAREEFATASFSLLTSRDEAFGLVLVESMGRGCIPISYDVRFGPSEIITDGVDGFLVEPLDNKAMAKAIRRVVTMDPDELSRMRVAAHRRALDFGAEPITRQWAKMLHEIRADRETSRRVAFYEPVRSA